MSDEPEPDGGCDHVGSPREARVDGATAEREGLRATVDSSLLERLGHVRAVAAREYRLVGRTRWTAGLGILFAVFSLSVVGLAGSAAGPNRLAAVVVTLTELSVYLVPLAALAFGYSTVVGARQGGTLDTLLVLPVSTGTVVVGKFLGRALALVTALALGLAPAGIALALRSGPGASTAYATYLFAAVGAGLAFLAVAVLVSTLAREKTRALGGVLLVWVLLVLVYDLVALATLAAFDLGMGGAVPLVLANPADVMRVVVLSLVPTTSGGLATVVPPGALSLPVLLAAFAVYVVGGVGLAALAVRLRD